MKRESQGIKENIVRGHMRPLSGAAREHEGTRADEHMLTAHNLLGGRHSAAANSLIFE